MTSKQLATDGIIFVYSKKVNDNVIKSDKKTGKVDIDKISKVVNTLLSFGKSKFLDELELNQNCTDWITSILLEYPAINERDVKELLNDFTDSMNTRMREEEKYAICIIASQFIILCHSRFGEETITPKWEVIERMLDKDNVLRYVFFERTEGRIGVIFFEDIPSVFFADWLGIPAKEAFGYLGGKNKFWGEVDGANIVFEFTDDDFEKKFFDENEEKKFKIQENQLILPNPVQYIPLVQIRVGRQPYDNVGDFIQDFLAKRYELSFYQEAYNKLNSSLNAELWTKKVIDDKFEVRDSNRNVLVKKTNTKCFIIFANSQIEIRPSFLSEIKSKLLNNEPIRIFHAGGRVPEVPLKIKNLEIFDLLDKKCSNILLDYFSNLQIKDDLENIFLYTLFRLLSLENSSKPISFFLRNLANCIISNIDFSNKFANVEDDVLELKSRDFVSGDNKQIVDNLTRDIKTKIQRSRFKVYVLGASEDTKDFEPLPISKFSDDRLRGIECSLKSEIGIQDLYLLKIPANNGKDCLLILCLRCEDAR